MPTGYTSDLYEGKPQTFAEFAMKCARAFGALIAMREDPMDAPIPDEFAPSDYHVKALDDARADLANVLAWGFDQSNREADADYERSLASHEKHQADARAVVARYHAMLAEVRAWTPPTPDHAEFRKFMVDQLESSIRHDGPFGAAPDRMSGRDYRAMRIDKAHRDIAYHEKGQAAEIERARSRTAWVRDLRASLPEASRSGSAATHP